MRAEEDQIPGNKVKQGVKPNPGKQPGDALWSHIRRLTDQVKSLELAVSTARRDINRIDRKQYREVDNNPPSQEPVLPAGLFT